MKNFKTWLKIKEGLFINDQKAEEGKSRIKKPPTKGNAVNNVSGVAGGAGGGRTNN
jgi:hypothetical protein